MTSGPPFVAHSQSQTFASLYIYTQTYYVFIIYMYANIYTNIYIASDRRRGGAGRLGVRVPLCSGSESGSYLRLIDSCITQLKAQGPSRTCNENKEEEAADQRGGGQQLTNPPGHLWRDKWTALSGPISSRTTRGTRASLQSSSLSMGRVCPTLASVCLTLAHVCPALTRVCRS